MAAQPLVSPPRFVMVPSRWLWAWAMGGMGVLFIVGLLATILFAVATQDEESLPATWLVPLLEICSWMPYALLLASLPAVWSTWRNRSKLARRLVVIMVLQFGLATVLALLPSWLVAVNLENYFGGSVDEAVAISGRLSTELVSQGHSRLEVSAREVMSKVSSLDPRSVAVGLTLDDLREQHDLDIIAIIDGKGSRLHISPVSAVLEGVSPFIMQRLNGGLVVRSVTTAKNGNLRLVRVQPQASTDNQQQVRTGDTSAWSGIWLERELPFNTSEDINAVEDVLLQYRQSKSVSIGIRQGLVLVVINAVALLLFAAINVASYTGTRLGRRLGTLSATMETVAQMPNPRGGVPVEGDDEITVVSKSFNEMVAKVGDTVALEQHTRADLEDIQNAIDVGLIVLDENNRIVSGNLAADVLCGTHLAVNSETLAVLVKRQPELADFVKLIGPPSELNSGETVIDKRKLWVRTTRKVDGNRIVMVSDISEPLAVEELRSRQDALSFTLHGIKNPLQPLLYHAESLDKIYPDVQGEAADFLRKKRTSILHQIHRINEQIESMRKLRDKDKVIYGPVDVNAIVRTCINHFRAPDIKVTLNLAEDLHPALFDRDELNEVLENLIINAQQQFELLGLEEREINISTSVNEDKIKLVITDNAGGIPPESMESIFRLHMSVKPGGQGLGLARVKMAVDSANGSVEVANVDVDKRKGARFTIALRQFRRFMIP